MATASWAEERSLQLLNPIGVNTHISRNDGERGHVIDLAFSSIPSAEANIDLSLRCGSDHETLVIRLPDSNQAKSNPRLRIGPDYHSAFRNALAMSTKLWQPVAHTPVALDKRAFDLIEAIQLTIRAIGRPVGRGGRASNWWNEECSSLQESLQTCADGLSYSTASKAFRKAVKNARRSGFAKFLSEASSDTDIFRVTKIGLPAALREPPAIQIEEGVFVEEPLQKAEALRKALLERFSAENDISDPWRTPVSPPQIPLQEAASEDEVRDCTIGVANTAAGKDEVAVATLSLAWPVISHLITDLFNACITVGYHPLPFKSAVVVMIGKANKPDPSRPNAWRPIALLSCLGKGLERLIARRLAYAAINHGVLNPQQFGALPKRAATDLVTCLVHDIEVAWSKGLVASLLTTDIKGAFDSILRNRLTLRLREQGWPIWLIRWVASFQSDRSVTVRLGDTTSDPASLSCGLPQGSPASPILFILYIAPLLKVLKNPERTFGYADDIGRLVCGPSLEQNVEDLKLDLEQILAWGRENAVDFEVTKTELIHFTRPRTQASKEPQPSLRLGAFNISPSEKLRWLGVILDSQLSFKPHVSLWAAKGIQVANRLHRLAGVSSGPPPLALRKALHACAISMAFFGTEAWFPGLEAPSIIPGRQNLVQTGIQAHVETLNRVVKRSMRIALPAFGTTRNELIHFESSTPPAEQLLAHIQRRFALRLARLDSSHPLVSRSKPPARPDRNSLPAQRGRPQKRFPRPTRLQRTASLCLSCPRPLLLPKCYASLYSPTEGLDKEKATARFREWQAALPTDDIIVFTDGSQDEYGRTGWGFAIYGGGPDPLKTGYGALARAEVFDAEAVAALNGLKTALQLAPSQTWIHICIDNTAVLWCLHGRPSDSSQATFLEFKDLARQRGQINLRWAPGHMDIEGNEMADQLAKKGCEEEAPDTPPTLSYAKRQLKFANRAAFEDWWDANAPATYRRKNKDGELVPRENASLTVRPSLSVPRASLGRWLAARSHHGDFAKYHARFQHEDAHLFCSCGLKKTPEHYAFCQLIWKLKHKWPEDLRKCRDPYRLYRATINQASAFHKLMTVTNFFTDICPRRPHRHASAASPPA
jgi:ribonuclease HI